jgi:PAS domain S-box-containing protein
MNGGHNDRNGQPDAEPHTRRVPDPHIRTQLLCTRDATAVIFRPKRRQRRVDTVRPTGSVVAHIAHVNASPEGTSVRTDRFAQASSQQPAAATAVPARGEHLSLIARLYVAAGIVGGGLLIALDAPAFPPSRPWLTLGLLVAAIVLSLFKVALPLRREGSTLTFTNAVAIAALLLCETEVATVIAVVSVLTQCVMRTRGRDQAYKALFSMATIAITVRAAGMVWTALGAGSLQSSASTAFVAMLAATTVYFAVNTGLIAAAIGLSTRTPVAHVWHDNFLWSAPNFFLSGSVALGVALVIVHGWFLVVPVVSVPLYLMYRAYRTYMDRFDAEQRHAWQLAELNAVTQEALDRARRSEAALVEEKQRLAVEKERLSATLANIDDGVITADANGLVLFMNAAAEHLTAVALSDAVQQPVSHLLTAARFQRDACFQSMGQVLCQGVPGRLVDRPKESAGAVASVVLEGSGTPIRDGDQRIIGGVWVLRDVTAAITLEQDRAKAARLDSLGVLAGGLAHDFNNHLTAVLGNLSLARSVAAPGELLTRLAEAEDACLRAKEVTSQLLTFSKRESPNPTTTSARELVDGGSITVESQEPVTASPRTHGQRILIMEDDAPVASVISLVLESLGYKTVVVRNGAEAIERCADAARAGAPFHVAILDLTVADGMGGKDTLPHLKRISSEITAIVTSGYAEDAVMLNFREYGFNAMLPKPFTLDDIRRAMAMADARGDTVESAACA